MLLIKTKLAPSKIHGLGLFADEDIKKGQRVWVCTTGFDIIIPIEKIRNYPIIAQNYLRKYAYQANGSGQLILCGDNARFVNHSIKPVLKNKRQRNNLGGFDVAVKHIYKGEELTINYQCIDTNWDYGFHEDALQE